MFSVHIRFSPSFINICFRSNSQFSSSKSKTCRRVDSSGRVRRQFCRNVAEDGGGCESRGNGSVQDQGLKAQGTLAVHAGERYLQRTIPDPVTTPIVNTTTHFFNTTSHLIHSKENLGASFEYGRYGNPTTRVAEEKISALEGAESTLITASGMCACTVVLMSLVLAFGHVVITKDCYRNTRIFIETLLPQMGIKVSLLYTESPTKPFLRCVDVKLVSELCHEKGALVCIDGTLQHLSARMPLPLGQILFFSLQQSPCGCVSGSEKLISQVRNLHYILGGVLNPVGGDFMATSKLVDVQNIPYIAPSCGGCERIVDQPLIMSYWYNGVEDSEASPGSGGHIGWGGTTSY